MTEVKGIGVDLAQIPRLRRVVERWNDRFLRRVFTEAEIAYCRRRRDPIPHFAARFAAKEATLKALGTGLRMGVNWRELEVRRERGQAPTMVLTGRSEAIARAKGASRVRLSLTHDGDYALAQAMLVGGLPDAGEGSRAAQGRRYNVNRPTESVAGDPPRPERETEAARRVYDSYGRSVADAAQGPLRVYVEIHGNGHQD